METLKIKTIEDYKDDKLQPIEFSVLYGRTNYKTYNVKEAKATIQIRVTTIN